MDVTAGIVSFQRPRCLVRLLQSIPESLRPSRILVVDNSAPARQGDIQEVVRQRSPEIELIFLPFDSGVGACRNEAFRRTVSEAFLVLEDDFVCIPDTDIQRLTASLRDGYDIVGGGVVGEDEQLQHGEYDLDVVGRHLIYTPVRVKAVREDSHPIECDFVQNFFVCRTESVRQALGSQPWSSRYKVGADHVDFFLRAKRQGLRVAYTPTVKIKHVPRRTKTYHRYRALRTTGFMAQFFDEHGLEGHALSEPVWK